MTRVAIVATVKAPENELTMFVNYHLNRGIDRIFLFFDDPSGDEANIFSAYDQVVTVLCTAEYWTRVASTGAAESKPKKLGLRQEVNADVAFALSHKEGFDWLIHLDSDELIFTGGDLKPILLESGVDILRFSMFEAIATKRTYESIFEPALFKVQPTQTQLQRVASLECRGVLYRGEYFRGHLASKSAVRVSPKIKRMGIHQPSEVDQSTTTSKTTSEISLLHFDCVGFENWKTKWGRRLNDSGIAHRMRDNRRSQLKAFGAAHAEGLSALEDLYDEVFTISDRDIEVLVSIGLVKQFDIREDLFEH